MFDDFEDTFNLLTKMVYPTYKVWMQKQNQLRTTAPETLFVFCIDPSPSTNVKSTFSTINDWTNVQTHSAFQSLMGFTVFMFDFYGD